MRYFNFNGRMLQTGTPVFSPDNTGLRYGDGLFETLKFKNGELILLDEHLARLWKGMQLLQIEIPKLFSPDSLQQQIISLLKKNNDYDARIRLSVTRGYGGLYDTDNQFQYVIESWPLPGFNGSINSNGLQAGIFRGTKKLADAFANCKHSNFLPYLMAARYAKQNQLNDAIILNNNGRICDSTIANVFLIKDGNIITPSLEEGCIAGVMRKYIIQKLSVTGMPCTEEAINIDLLLEADEVFFTNSMYNMRWVSNIDESNYSNKITLEIFANLAQTNPLVFC